MVVQLGNLRWCNAGILELEGRPLLATQDDDIFALDSDSAGSYSAQRRVSVRVKQNQVRELQKAD